MTGERDEANDGGRDGSAVKSEGMAGQTGKILVVDDYPMNRLKLARVLEQQGHSASLAENGEEALRLLRSQPFDVVLLDIMMPEMDGHQVLEIMKRDKGLRAIPVIVISAVDEVESAVRCIEMGAEDYIPKPFNPVFLKARLSASLRQKKLRDLEKAYLQQELTLRQSEKLATLGRLSAGMAHELNNPAAAVRRGVAQLQSAFAQQVAAHLTLDLSELTAERVAQLRELEERARSKSRSDDRLDPLSRSDLENAIEDWLVEQGVEDGWRYAPDLVALGYEPDELAAVLSHFESEQVATVLAWLGSVYTTHSVLQEVREGAGRMSEIVKALKVYTYLDQAPVQNVDVHEGLENTLVMLRSRLKQGISVRREYAEALPLIEAYGSELNQVWTNILDNAIAAMDGSGEITIRTFRKGEWVAVEIGDNGPGISQEIQAQIFDPFFTTKAPGEGTGLGLSISHSIITQKHKGRLSVTSSPGNTCFQALLPLRLGSADDE